MNLAKGYGKAEVQAHADLIGRTGATNLEVGYLHDDVPSHEAGWYAHAQYRGARVTVEDKVGPAEALRALAVRLLAGATCRWCGKQISIRSRTSRRRCSWKLTNGRWERGCRSTETVVPEPSWVRGGGS